MNFDPKNYTRRPRPHIDPEVEAIFQQIDAMATKDLKTPFAPEKGDDAPAWVDRGDIQGETDPKKERKARRTAPEIVFGGRKIK
jgi:hypothetical protein